ncbi:MAG: hypothetical protein DMF80_09170 [Acidobacteria bacterium]|nr:MAG: hypothetical protein DMF80_09170 [Acidobacteriota bacterium]PYQ20019.1 MAG: hypothetical protein DMF81_19970 [Acidobacteriota bacterium]
MGLLALEELEARRTATSQRAIQRKFTGQQELKPFLRTFRRADGVGIALLLTDRLLTYRQGQVTGIRTAMVEMPTAE